MIDYYEVLGVSADASLRDIRSSFRRLAHKYHPDRNPVGLKAAEDKMRLAIEAYRVLGSDGQRLLYDQRLRMASALKRDPYRERLVRGKHRPPLRAALILYDLLEGRAEEALGTYEHGILENGGFDLSQFLPVRDWLDCTLLLAEQYEERKRYVWALNLYEEVYGCAEARRRYREFFFEIRDRIRDICWKVLAKEAELEQAVGYYMRALRLDLPGAEAAFIHKKLAERYHRAGRQEEACAALRTALDLYPTLRGARRISQKLCFARNGVRAGAR